MRKLTIAELRAKEVERLSEYTGSIEVARHLMNRFYRQCGRDFRLLELENNERTCNLSWVIRDSERNLELFKMLQADFQKYGLDLKYSGVVPTICEYTPGDSRIGREIIGRHFY